MANRRSGQLPCSSGPCHHPRWSSDLSGRRRHVECSLAVLIQLSTMSVRMVHDPIEDPRWAELLDRHPSASIFHSPGWLNALRRTYGYEPFVVTTTGSSSLPSAIVACRVNGWTSSRLVSLPFSDHCDPLVSDADVLTDMLTFLSADASKRGAAYVELRPT